MTSLTDEDRINFMKNLKQFIRLCNKDNKFDKLASKIKIDEKQLKQEIIFEYMNPFLISYNNYKENIINESYKNVIVNIDSKELKIDNILQQFNDEDKKQFRCRLVRCIYFSLCNRDENIVKLYNKFVSSDNTKVLGKLSSTISDKLINMQTFKDLNRTGETGTEAFTKALKEAASLGDDVEFKKDLDEFFKKVNKGKISDEDLVKQLAKEVTNLRNMSRQKQKHR